VTTERTFELKRWLNARYNACMPTKKLVPFSLSKILYYYVLQETIEIRTRDWHLRLKSATIIAMRNMKTLSNCPRKSAK